MLGRTAVLPTLGGFALRPPGFFNASHRRRAMGAVLRNLSQYESRLQPGLYRSLLMCFQLRGPRILSSPKAHLASGALSRAHYRSVNAGWHAGLPKLAP
jgi:hypothetical protein